MDKDAYEGTMIRPLEVEPMGSINTASDPSKIISIPDGGSKPLEEVRLTLLAAQNRIVDLVKADEAKGLFDAETMQALEMIANALLDGVAYCEHVDKAINLFVENFAKEIFPIP